MLYRGPGFHAVEWLGSTTTPSPRLPPHRKTEKERQIAAGREESRRWAWSQITEPQESLVLYKLFNTRWCNSSCHACFYSWLRSKCLMTESTKSYTYVSFPQWKKGSPTPLDRHQLAGSWQLPETYIGTSAYVVRWFSNFNCISNKLTTMKITNPGFLSCTSTFHFNAQQQVHDVHLCSFLYLSFCWSRTQANVSCWTIKPQKLKQYFLRHSAPT
jgi:hypothetical protein